MKKNFKLILFVIILLMIFLVEKKFGILSTYISKNNIETIKAIAEENKLLASMIYVVSTVVGSVLLALPGVTFAIIAGAVFGAFYGTFLCALSATIGAIISFVVGRYFLKDSIKPKLENNKVLSKLLFSDNRENDVMILMITRLLPIFPYNLQNFAYGITDISIWTYSLYTFIFLIPGSAMFTLISAGSISKENAKMYYMIAALIFIIVFAFGLFLKKYLKKKNISEN